MMMNYKPYNVDDDASVEMIICGIITSIIISFILSSGAFIDRLNVASKLESISITKDNVSVGYLEINKNYVPLIYQCLINNITKEIYACKYVWENIKNLYFNNIDSLTLYRYENIYFEKIETHKFSTIFLLIIALIAILFVLTGLVNSCLVWNISKMVHYSVENYDLTTDRHVQNLNDFIKENRTIDLSSTIVVGLIAIVYLVFMITIIDNGTSPYYKDLSKCNVKLNYLSSIYEQGTKRYYYEKITTMNNKTISKNIMIKDYSIMLMNNITHAEINGICFKKGIIIDSMSSFKLGNQIDIIILVNIVSILILIFAVYLQSPTEKQLEKLFIKELTEKYRERFSHLEGGTLVN